MESQDQSQYISFIESQEMIFLSLDILPVNEKKSLVWRSWNEWEQRFFSHKIFVTHSFSFQLQKFWYETHIIPLENSSFKIIFLYPLHVFTLKFSIKIIMFMWDIFEHLHQRRRDKRIFINWISTRKKCERHTSFRHWKLYNIIDWWTYKNTYRVCRNSESISFCPVFIVSLKLRLFFHSDIKIFNYVSVK